MNYSYKAKRLGLMFACITREAGHNHEINILLAGWRVIVLYMVNLASSWWIKDLCAVRLGGKSIGETL